MRSAFPSHGYVVTHGMNPYRPDENSAMLALDLRGGNPYNKGELFDNPIFLKYGVTLYRSRV